MTSESDDFYHDLYWTKAYDQLNKALIRTFNAEEVLANFDFTFAQNYEYRIALIKRLVLLCKEESTNIKFARKLASRLLKKENEIPSSRRKALDTTLIQIAHLLTPKEQIKLSIEFTQHRRASRRKIGFKLIELQFQIYHKQLLLECFEKYRDEFALVTLTRVDTNIIDIADFMLKNISSLSQQAAVFAKLVIQDFASALELSHKYPVPFVWGVGRSQCQNGLARTVEIVRESSKDYEKYHKHIGLLLWALGRLNAKTELIQLATDFDAVK